MPKVGRFVFLDGMRGVAALSVVAVHVGEVFKLSVYPRHAYLAVDFFYMLSGFILASAYEEKLKSDLSPWRFFEIRIVRLYPLIFLGVLVGALYLTLRLAILRDVTPIQILAASVFGLLLMPTPRAGNGGTFPINQPLWSLSWEVLINVAYALVVRRLTSRILVGIVALSSLGEIAMIATNQGVEVGHFWNPTFAWGAIRVCFPFAAGCLLCHVIKLRPAPRFVAMEFDIALALIFTFFAPGAGNAVYDAAAIFIAFPLAIYFGASTTASFPAAYLLMGELCYPIYALHFPIIRTAYLISEGWSTSLQIAASVIGTSLSLGASYLIWRFIDTPLRFRLTRGLLFAGRSRGNELAAP